MKIVIAFPQGIDGAVQVGDFAKKTLNGQAEFDVAPGDYQIRGMAMGYRGTVKTISVTENNQVFSLDVRGD